MQSIVLTRSLSQRLKFVLATHDKIVIMSTSNGAVENQVSFDDVINSEAPIRLSPFEKGFAIMNENKVLVKKLASSGKIDEVF